MHQRQFGGKHGSCQLLMLAGMRGVICPRREKRGTGSDDDKRGRRGGEGEARARQETHGAIRAHQNREPDENQRRFENCNAGWRRVSACSPGQRPPPGLARRVPGLSGCTVPRRARPPLLQSPSRPNCAAPAQNWGRMAHAVGLVRAQMAHGASLARAGPRTARAAQATACGTRRVHGAAPIACHARQEGRGRCCCRAWAARRARVAWARARLGQAPAARRGATQGAVWASGWLGHSRLLTFARELW